jgi:hypothetical protein
MNTKLARLAGLTAAMALTMTAAAQAHPGVYSVDAKIAATAAQQTITVTGGAGSFKPSAGATDVAVGASAAAVEAALQADPAIGYDNIDVTGADGGPYTLTWKGSLAGKKVAALAPVSPIGVTVTDTVDAPGGDAVTFGSDPLGLKMATQRQFIVASDGYVLGYKETNHLAGGGLVNLKMLPTGYRTPPPPAAGPLTPETTPMTPEQKIGYLAAQSGIQLHATCTNVAALQDATNIYKWQVRPDNDPFYAYIPWQKTAAGLGDDPAKWIPVVKDLTGVDLSTLNTVADFTAACASLHGTYVPADQASSVTQAVVADAVTAATTPLTAQIADLTSAKKAADAAKADLENQLAAAKADAAAARADAAAARAEVSRLNAGARAGRLTIAKDGPAALDGTQTPVAVSGPAGAPVLVRLVVSPGQARELHLKSRLLGTATQLISADGTTTVNLAVARKLTAAAQKAGVKRVIIDAISGDRYVRIPAGA